MVLIGYLLAILPAAAITFFAIKRLEKKPVKWIVMALVLGMIAIVPAFQFERIETLFENPIGKGWPLFIVSFGLVGMGEEIFKALALFAFAYFSKEVTSIKRGIVYSILVAMGFALVENVFYAYIYPLSTVVVRSFTAVPAHAVFAIIVGYFLGLNISLKQKHWWFFLRGVLFAGILHGAYDWFILQEYNENLTGGAIAVLCLGIFYAYWLLKYSKQRSLVNPPAAPNPSDSSLPDEKDLPDDPPVEPNDA